MSPSVHLSRRVALGWMLVWVSCWFSTASCAGTTTPTTTTNTAPAAALSVTCSGSAQYTGTITLPSQQQSSVDLTLFFDLPTAATDCKVRGSYTTGISVNGTIVDAIVDKNTGAFTGNLQTSLANGCVATTSYGGTLTDTSLSWTPGARVDTCGGANPLNFSAAATAPPRPPTTTTTSAPASTSTSSSTSTSTSSTPSTSTTTAPLVTFTLSVGGAAQPYCVPYAVNWPGPIFTINTPGPWGSSARPTLAAGTVAQLSTSAAGAVTWTGCDSVSSSVCTVTMNADRAPRMNLAEACPTPSFAAVAKVPLLLDWVISFTVVNTVPWVPMGPSDPFPVGVTASCPGFSRSQQFHSNLAGTVVGTINVPQSSCSGGTLTVTDWNGAASSPW